MPFVILWMAFRALVAFIEGAASQLKGKETKATHGDAAWADLKQLKAAGHLQPNGMLVGWDKQRIYADRESSVLVIAPKRQGKTQTIIAAIRDVCLRQVKPDLILYDPAGDIRTGTIEALMAAGYQTCIIDLTNPRDSTKYDPLSFLRPDWIYDFDRDVNSLCELILPEDAQSMQPHFQEFSRLLLAGTVAYLVEKEPSITLNEIVQRLTADAHKRRLMFEAMDKDAGPLTKQAINAFKEAGDREKGSFSTTMARKLNIWLWQSVKEVTTADKRWSWDDMFMDAKPVAVFIKSGLGGGEGAFARLAIGNAINSVRRLWNKTHQPLPKGLWLIVDEAVSIGNCNAIMDANNELGKAGVNTMLCYLNVEGIRQTFPKSETLLGNNTFVVFGGGTDMSYYREISDMLGEYTIQNPSRTENDSGESKSDTDQPRKLFKADEIRRLAPDEELVVMGPLSVRCKKTWYKGPNNIVYR